MWTSQGSHAQSQNQTSEQGQTNQKTLGMTSAITLAGPKVLDVQRTTELVEALKPYNVTESDQELTHR
jgi:poly(A) polymerase